MTIGEDTSGFCWLRYCSSLLLATLAGVRGLASGAGLLPGAVWGDVVTGVAAATHVRVAAVAAPATGGLVEVEAHGLGTTRFSVEFSRRTDILSVITAGANVAVGLSQARESHRPEFEVDLIPA